MSKFRFLKSTHAWTNAYDLTLTVLKKASPVYLIWKNIFIYIYFYSLCWQSPQKGHHLKGLMAFTEEVTIKEVTHLYPTVNSFPCDGNLPAALQYTYTRELPSWTATWLTRLLTNQCFHKLNVRQSSVKLTFVWPEKKTAAPVAL